MIVKSEPYTMPAHGQDQWWRPMTNIDLNEPRWVRTPLKCVRGTPAGRKIRTWHSASGAARSRRSKDWRGRG